MYDGTLARRGPWEALVTFQQLIVLANKRGEVDITADAIARRTTIPLAIIEKGIKHLLKTDPESRTPALQGRRIVPLSPERKWGWRIVNYEHYNRIRSEEERTEYHRQYYHSKRKNVETQHSTADLRVSTDSTAVAVPVPVPIKKKKPQAIPLPADFKISDAVKTWAVEKGHSNLDQYLEFFKGRMSANGKTYVDWDQALMNCIREDWPKLRKPGAQPAPEEACSACKGSLKAGYIKTSKGKVCNNCRQG